MNTVAVRRRSAVSQVKPLSKPLVIMLHGRNAGPENILDLVPRLGCPQFQYIAPAAPNRTWYPYSFMAEIEKNEPFLSNALAQVRQVVTDAEASGVPRDRIVLLGFSQGACLATEFMIRNASRFGGFDCVQRRCDRPTGHHVGRIREIRRHADVLRLQRCRCAYSGSARARERGGV